jgi:hypothetical protein
VTSRSMLTKLTPGWGALGDVRPRTANPYIAAGAAHRMDGTRVPTTKFGWTQQNAQAFAALYHREEPR